jgi:signal transduction histidine kinase
VRIRLLQTDSFRHAAIYAVLFVGSMAILVAIVYAILDNAFKENLLRENNDSLASIRTAYLTASRGREEHEAKEMVEDRLLAPDTDDVYLLERGQKRLAGNLPPMPHTTGVIYVPFPNRFGKNGSEHLILGRGERLSKDVYAFVGQDLYAARQAERRVLWTFGLVLLASLVLASASGLLLSRGFLRRVDSITDTCRSIMAGRLQDRIRLTGRDNELERLGAAINAMLDRIEALMESLRQVSTDIAHDLRTPLTHLRHRLEHARTHATATAEYATAVDGAIAECDELLSVFTALLRIAQIEAGARRQEFTDVSLPQLIRRAADMYKPVMDDSDHPFEVDAGEKSEIRGDPQLLLQMISNLLENAIRHTPGGTLVKLASGKQDGCPAVIIADTGGGIPEDERENVRRRFYRREQSRTTTGSGLGLSLVTAIADLHDATLTLGDNMPGLQVVVTFPGHAG